MLFALLVAASPPPQYNSVIQWQQSTEFRTNVRRRCATDPRMQSIIGLRSASDCSFTQTAIKAEYNVANGDTFVIPVVFHVVKRSDGTGDISDALLKSQIDVLNEDYMAMANTPGKDSVPAGVRFVLATTDPAGKPTTGITRTTNNAWFNDPGPDADNPMKQALHWDTTKYLNIYTNDANGALGYSTFPQEEAGGPQDGVVLVYSSVGRDAPEGGIYDQGRTATHEVGHYLGLLHTFQGGCGTTYTSGDLLKDTPPQSSPQYDCPSGPDAESCGGDADPHNFMNYTQDTCLFHFSTEQVNRLRCSIMNYRPTMMAVAKCGDGKVSSGEACDDGNTRDGDGCSKDCTSDESCGNGKIDATVGEVCDDGNTKAGDKCRADCKGKEVCGDGQLDTVKGEICDDGNTKSGDGCASDCKGKEVCGDGIIDPEKGEVCDDGNTSDGDGCSKSCKSDETCGNGIVDAGEECDGEDDCDSSCNKKKPTQQTTTTVQPQSKGGVSTTANAGTTNTNGCNSAGEPWTLVFLGLGLLRLRRKRA